MKLFQGILIDHIYKSLNSKQYKFEFGEDHNTLYMYVKYNGGSIYKVRNVRGWVYERCWNVSDPIELLDLHNIFKILGLN